MVNVSDSKGFPSVLIVILNYRTPDLTIDCLRSLVDEVKALSQVQVIITDNDSGDDSAEKIPHAIETEGWGDWATFMPLPKNGGFAYGNNAPIRAAMESGTLPDYVHLLNPDTVIRPGAVQRLLEFMDAHPDVGIAGSRLEDPDTTPQNSAFRFHTLWSELDGGLRLGLYTKLMADRMVIQPVSDVSHQTDWVAGASMIIRREVLEQVGLMDEDYFMYYEEMDFCLQANRAGWPCWYVPESRVVHLVGQSSGVTDTKRVAKRRPQYVFDSRRRYFLKNHGAVYTAIADHLWSSSYLLWRIRNSIQRKPANEPPHLLGDFIRNSVLRRGTSL